MYREVAQSPPHLAIVVEAVAEVVAGPVEDFFGWWRRVDTGDERLVRSTG